MADLQNQIDAKEVEAYILWHQANDTTDEKIKTELSNKYEKVSKDLERLESELNRQ
jgi:oligoendopeptidase F